MSFANQPARLLISSDDLDYGQGNSFTISLPEAITGAKKADLIRAVIPNTGYPIPSYQAQFYYFVDTTPTIVQVLSLNVDQYFDSIVGGSNPLITALNNEIALQGLDLIFTYSTTTNRITLASTDVAVDIRVASQSEWMSEFSLNTRLGYQNQQSPVFAQSIQAEIMPNLIRSKVIYVLCNIVLNDSISTDGLRTAIAKIPVNSSYGGLTLYVPPQIVWNRLIQGIGYTTITISLLDDQYQPYPLNTEEFCELEIALKYDDSMPYV